MYETRLIRLVVLFTLSVLILILFGCSVSTGGYYVEGGPHPHVNVAVAARVGPVELLHSPTLNAGADLTRLSVNYGPTLGHFQPTVGLGYAGWRTWGKCNGDGYWCEHEWLSSFTVGMGLTYRLPPARIDGAFHIYDGNAPRSWGATLMMGVDF